MHRVTALEKLGPNLFELIVTREDLEYRAADCTLLIHSDGISSRPYSFSSHPDQDNLSFLFRRISGGFSDWLAGLRPGDQLGVGTPFGDFHPQGDNEVWLATGTGLAPFLSVLRGNLARPPRCFWFGVRSRNEAIFSDFIGSKTPLTITFSQDSPSNQRERRGRLTQFLKELPVTIDLEYYLCGHAGMIRESRLHLVSAGVLETQLHGEAFY